MEVMHVMENHPVPVMVESSTSLLENLDHRHHEHHGVKLIAGISRYRGWELSMVGGIVLPRPN